MLRRYSRLFLLVPLVLFSCGEIEEIIDETEHTGYMQFYSDIDTVDRYMAVDGYYLTGNFALMHNPAEEGQHDGDNGIDLYLRFKDTTMLVPGDTLAIGTPGIDFWIARWATPAGYDKYTADDIEGYFIVQENDLPRSMLVEVSATFDQFGEMVRYQTTARLNLSSPWGKVPDDLIPDWDEWDASSAIMKDSITKDTLAGMWEANTGVEEQPAGVMQLFWSHGAYWLNIKDGRMKTSDYETYHPFEIDSNSITGPEPGTINFVSDSKLVITWKTGDRRVRRNYVKTMDD